MKSFTLALLLASSIAQAGNESGGNWIVTRFRARATLALSELCRYPETVRGLSDPELQRLEGVVANTAVQGVTEQDANAVGKEIDWHQQAYRIVPSEKGPTIQLRKKLWEHYFDANVDVHAEALAPFLEVFGAPKPLEKAEELNLSGLATGGLFVFDRNDPGRGIPTLHLNGVYWKQLPGRFSFAAAETACTGLNARPATSSLARWALATAEGISGATKALLPYTDALPYKRPSSYRVWIRGGRVADLFEPALNDAGAENHGALCAGTPLE